MEKQGSRIRQTEAPPAAPAAAPRPAPTRRTRGRSRDTVCVWAVAVPDDQIRVSAVQAEDDDRGAVPCHGAVRRRSARRRGASCDLYSYCLAPPYGNLLYYNRCGRILQSMRLKSRLIFGKNSHAVPSDKRLIFAVYSISGDACSTKVLF